MMRMTTYTDYMRVIFDRFRVEHLKLKPSKCSLFHDEIVFLAHHVMKDGVQPSEEHVKAITNFPEPDSYTSIWQFVGMVGHFRCFIMHIAQLVRPLNNHLEGDASKLKAHKVVLSQKAKEAFNLLKQALLQAPVLKYTDYSNPSCWRLMHPLMGWEQYCSRKGRMESYIPLLTGVDHWLRLREIITQVRPNSSHSSGLLWTIPKSISSTSPSLCRLTIIPSLIFLPPLISMHADFNGWPLSPTLTSPLISAW